MVFIAVQNLNGFDTVFSIIRMFFRFHPLGSKMPIHASKGGVLEI